LTLGAALAGLPQKPIPISATDEGLVLVPHHADLVNVEVAVVLSCSVRPEAMLAVERLGTRVRIGHPQRRVIVTDHGRKQATAGTGTVSRGQDVENEKLYWPVSIRVYCWSCRRDPGHLTVSLSDSHAVHGVTLVTQRGGPESLAPFHEARTVKDFVCHEPPVGLLP
jgi:hypothetical protein